MNISITEINRDIAELEAILAAMAKKRVLMAEVQAADLDSMKDIHGPQFLKDAAAMVSTQFQLPLNKIMGPRRTEDVAFARQVICWLAHEHGLRGVKIEAFFGKKHGMLDCAIKRVESRMETEPKLRDKILRIRNELKQ